MKFSIKNFVINKDCVEIRKKGIIYWRIFLLRAVIQDFHINSSIICLIKAIDQKLGSLTQNFVFSIEIGKNKVIFFYLTRNGELENKSHLEKFKKNVESVLGNKLEELTNNDVEKYFWGIFYKNIDLSDIKIEERSYKFLIKERPIHLAIFSIKNFEIVRGVIELISSLKIKDFMLFFKINLQTSPKLDMNLSIESESINKIQEFYAIISSNFPREAISLFVPNRLLFIQYLLKFLCFNRISAGKLPKFIQFRSPQQFLKKQDFEEIRPFIYIHRKKRISVIVLKKLNLRSVKYYLKTYYQKYFIVFWVLNAKLSRILKKSTKIHTLENCMIQNKNFDSGFWEKALQWNLENS